MRLGVVWAGAQPKDSDELDADFVKRLHAVLDLTDAAGLAVVLDNHGDQVGTASCGNGVPVWFQQRAAPDLIGAPLTTELPYSLFLPIDAVAGYDTCGAGNASRWAEHAGDPNYNLLNECCKAMNSRNPGGLGFTAVSQRTMTYLLRPGAGRDAFVRFWRLLAREVAQHPSAVACELMNEPRTIHRRLMFDTWRACGEAINAEVPDMLVSVSDVGEDAVMPWWVAKYGGAAGANIDISDWAMSWIKSSGTAFYAWHWYGPPSMAKAEEAVRRAQATGEDWGIPTIATEFMSPAVWRATAAANMSHLYWHYSAYCNTGPAFGNRRVPEETFGACILGWGAGTSTYPPPLAAPATTATSAH